MIAGALLLMALPLIAFGAALSFAHYRAWPFFVHERVGLGGQTFRFFKIRTLPPAIDRYADKYALIGAGVPPLMQLVRRLHFDEFPQLAHVVSGKMTFVGPRPEMQCLHDTLPPRFAQLRTSVRPGLTCLWQISPHSAGLIGERSEYDRLYVDYRNARLDLWIMAQTARKMTTGRTVHLHEVPQWLVDKRPLMPVPTRPERPVTLAAGPEPVRQQLSLVD